MDSDEWGEGSGVGTYERGGSAARPSSSVCALVVRVRARRLCAHSSSVCTLVVRVRARRLCARSSSVCALIVLSMGVRYAWVARRRCLREARRCLGVGVISCGPWVVFLFMGRGRRWWVWGVVHGCCVIVVGAGLLFMGTGLPIVGGGARSRGRVVRVCWFVIRGRGGDVSSALWSLLATLEGTRVGVLTMDVSINNDEQRHRRRSSFGCHITLSNVAPAPPPHPSPSVVTWHWSSAVVVVFGVWMVGDGRRWATMGDNGRQWWWWE